ncbi:recombinase family protein, partial [Acinetobacter baumannii]
KIWLDFSGLQIGQCRRLRFRLARDGSGSSGPTGVRFIATHLSRSGIRTRDGGRWSVDAVHKVLTRTTCIGRHRLNTNTKA